MMILDSGLLFWATLYTAGNIVFNELTEATTSEKAVVLWVVSGFRHILPTVQTVTRIYSFRFH